MNYEECIKNESYEENVKLLENYITYCNYERKRKLSDSLSKLTRDFIPFVLLQDRQVPRHQLHHYIQVTLEVYKVS